MDFLSGHLLAASPHLGDPNFAHAVVLIVQHTEQGAFGLVLNRPSQHTLREIWERVGQQPCDSDQPLNVGGPIEGPLMALHSETDLSEGQVLPGVYFSAQREALERIVGQRERPFLIFTGYAGWGEGQLESELQSGAWLTTRHGAEYIFHADENLWKQVAKHIGDEILFSAIKFKHVPEDPRAN